MEAAFSSISAKSLAVLVAESIAASSYTLNGLSWCRLSHRERASAIGVNESTVRRIIGKPPGIAPFVTTTRIIDGTRTTLVRIGEPSPEDRHRETAIILRTIWRKYLAANVTPKREELKLKIQALKETGPKAELTETYKTLNRLHGDQETPREFGCFSGLAQDWPDGLQPELFSMVLTDYPAFMAGAKTVAFLDPPTTEKIYDKELEAIFQKFPHVPTIRRFWKVAVEMMEAKCQEKGTAPSSLIAVNPHLWSHLKA